MMESKHDVSMSMLKNTIKTLATSAGEAPRVRDVGPAPGPARSARAAPSRAARELGRTRINPDMERFVKAMEDRHQSSMSVLKQTVSVLAEQVGEKTSLCEVSASSSGVGAARDEGGFRRENEVLQHFSGGRGVAPEVTLLRSMKGKQARDCLLYTSPSPRDS
eukprot:TRINITY_DN19738_c0_g1_i4.p1 TRINITY_DN19738_c0_g1~~TRINITY_DN19738_c0_g1_i4.p1  ORF type:complete len:163 (+),score=33.55 TRINITY_DN19738_c0_g1_i4:271-759(+)